ncbi:ABC transporter permease [Lysinibacillus sp. NPDC096418]|uniref:ABC transporter permease n=1 Tax=Lysinibacillus sp. NPDC096418 TaxID=3364138 RepID=UPI003812F41B
MYWMLIKLEWKQMLRSRWMQIVGLLFTFVFTAIVVIQQMALPDATGFTRQTASFLNVLLFLLPLFLLTIGSMSVAGDMESGWFSLLKTYPMKRMQYIIGKFIASVFAFLLVVVVAFGLVFSLGGLLGGVRLPLIFINMTLLNILIFAALAIFVGALTKTRLSALSVSLVLWSFFLLLFSYAIMAIGTFVAGHILQKIIIVAIHVNPVEWLRFGYFIFSGQADVLGPSFYNLTQFYTSSLGNVVYGCGTLLWIFVPLLGTSVLLKKGGRH